MSEHPHRRSDAGLVQSLNDLRDQVAFPPTPDVTALSVSGWRSSLPAR